MESSIKATTVDYRNIFDVMMSSIPNPLLSTKNKHLRRYGVIYQSPRSTTKTTSTAWSHLSKSPLSTIKISSSSWCHLSNSMSTINTYTSYTLLCHLSKPPMPTKKMLWCHLSKPPLPIKTVSWCHLSNLPQPTTKIGPILNVILNVHQNHHDRQQGCLLRHGVIHETHWRLYPQIATYEA